jgi:hypothetical protein
MAVRVPRGVVWSRIFVEGRNPRPITASTMRPRLGGHDPLQPRQTVTTRSRPLMFALEAAGNPVVSGDPRKWSEPRARRPSVWRGGWRTT